MQAVDFKCPLCDSQSFDLFLFTKHLRHHQNEEGFVVSCFACDRSFKEVKKWRRHISTHIGSRYTRVPVPVVSSGDLPGANEETSSTSNQNEHQTPSADSVQNDMCMAKEQSDEPKNYEGKVLNFVLDLKTKGLPEKHCFEVVKTVSEFCVSAVEDFKAAQNEGNPIASTDDVPIVASLSKLLTTAKRDKYMRLHHYLVKPVTVKLPNGGDMQYVPILEQLEYVLENDKARSLLLTTPQQQKTGYRSFHDGTMHAGKFGQVNLSIYFDEFGVSNPLGNKVVNQKLGAFYFGLPDMSSGQLKHIFLAILVRSKYFKTESLDVILEPLLKDLSRLKTDGICIVVDGEERKIHGSVCFVLGDNLGQHFLGRFNTSFAGGNRLCRFCHISHKELSSVFSASKCKARTMEEYASEISALKESGYDEKISQLFGLKDECPLNKIPGFNIIDHQPPDIAHDIFEGIGPVVLSLVLTALVKEHKAFTLSDLNAAIVMFSYDSNVDRNRPQPMTMKPIGISVKQTASECWCLFRLLPQMIGARVPDGCLEWDVFLGLREIIEYVCAPRLTDDHLNCLEDSIESWLHLFSTVFPHCRMTPKFHYLIHYPSEMRKHGPLRHVWTLRFENKHQELKNIAKSSRNRRNLARTIALGHQRNVCRMLAGRFTHGFGETLVEDIVFGKRKLLGNRHIRSCKINGVRHAVGEVLILGRNKFKSFVVVRTISAEGMLSVEELDIRDFSATIQAYILAKKGVFKNVEVSDLNGQPLACYRSGHEMLTVVLHHKVVGLD